MARRARMRPSLKIRLTVMPASASAATITRNSICNDAVGFVVDEFRSRKRNPWCRLLHGGLLHLLGVILLLLVRGLIGDRGGAEDIGRIA